MIDRRRAFIVTGCGSLLALALPLFAQLKKPVRIASLATGTQQSIGYLVDTFRKALSDLGYVEGRDIVYEYRWAEGRNDRVPALAAELARTKPDIILTATIVTARAAVEAAPAATILLVYVSDPVGNKLVASLSRPGGRITGVSNLGEGMVAKMVEMLHAMVPQAQRFAVLVNPTNVAGHAFAADAESAAKTLKITPVRLEAATPEELGPAFERIARERPQGIIVTTDGMFLTMRARIVELAARAAIPAIYYQREFVEAGGLMSYGPSILDAYIRVATFADRIIKGARPGDLPIEQPTRFVLVVNLKTANTLGIPIPRSLLLRADEVIGS